MGIRDILAANLRRLRQEQGVSQEELAHLAHVDRTYVSSLERGVYGATVDTLERLAGALKTEAWKLLKP